MVVRQSGGAAEIISYHRIPSNFGASVPRIYRDVSGTVTDHRRCCIFGARIGEQDCERTNRFVSLRVNSGVNYCVQTKGQTSAIFDVGSEFEIIAIVGDTWFFPSGDFTT